MHDTDRPGPAFFLSDVDEHAAVLAATRESCGPAMAAMLDAWTAAVRGGGKILFFGNGGSAGDAQHLATELTVRFRDSRAPIPAIALTTDSSALTAIGNDLGFDQLFARQVRALAAPGDVAVGISTSGRSANVANGLIAARELGATAAAFTGGDGGDIAALAEPELRVPSAVTARVQEMHILLGQSLCGALERALGLVPGDAAG